MDDRQAFLSAIEASPWDDESVRLVYADWLDEHGEHEEADRQRKYVSSERWLRDFARKHDFHGYDEQEDHKDNIETGFGQLMYFLERHTDDEFYLPFDTPYGFGEYSDELWTHFEIVTGQKSPKANTGITFPHSDVLVRPFVSANMG